MKNRNKLTRILAFSIGLAGTIFILSSCAENKSNENGDMMDDDNSAERIGTDGTRANDTILVVENDEDNEFLMKATEMQLAEIKLGQLAQQKGSTDQVKNFGKMMVEDHTKVLAEIRTLAQSNSVTVPTAETDASRNSFEDLNGKTGADFEKSYTDLMVEHHEDAIDLFEKASNDSENQEIRTWATGKLPALREHLKMAEANKEAADRM